MGWVGGAGFEKGPMRGEVTTRSMSGGNVGSMQMARLCRPVRNRRRCAAERWCQEGAPSTTQHSSLQHPKQAERLTHRRLPRGCSTAWPRQASRDLIRQNNTFTDPLSPHLAHAGQHSLHCAQLAQPLPGCLVAPGQGGQRLEVRHGGLCRAGQGVVRCRQCRESEPGVGGCEKPAAQRSGSDRRKHAHKGAAS